MRQNSGNFKKNNITMNATQFCKTLASLALLGGGLTSCAITDWESDVADVSANASSNLAAHRFTSSPLICGVKYEVRKAVMPQQPVNLYANKSYHFEVPAVKAASSTASVSPKTMVHPPMLAAARPSGSQLHVRTTAYCHDESDHIVYGAKNALGTPLLFGQVRSAAADWSRYPVGTVFKICGQPGITYVVDDYGSALVGTGTIDMYMPTRSAMNEWGVRHIDIEVVRWGSYHRSMSIMRDRARWPHVRRMIEGIEARMYRVPSAVASTDVGAPFRQQSTL
jgi:3D (Asp-Asp-Asp) domain-containing protein